jgi:gallate decarboxylase subunit D
MEFTVQTQTGAYDLQAAVRFVGKDILVAIWGGDRPHIGAVAIAQPRPSLRDPKEISATTSVYCFLGHKEDALAKAAANTLAAKLNTQTVVTAGIHWDNINEEGIRIVNANSLLLTELILSHILPK